MLKIEQMEGNLVVIDLNINDTVKFHGVFRSVNVDESTLEPMENGFKMEIGLTDN